MIIVESLIIQLVQGQQWKMQSLVTQEGLTISMIRIKVNKDEMAPVSLSQSGN